MADSGKYEEKNQLKQLNDLLICTQIIRVYGFSLHRSMAWKNSQNERKTINKLNCIISWNCFRFSAPFSPHSHQVKIVYHHHHFFFRLLFRYPIQILFSWRANYIKNDGLRERRKVKEKAGKIQSLPIQWMEKSCVYIWLWLRPSISLLFFI